MLRNVCDCCGAVIDGEPSIGKEYPEVVLLIDDEIEVMYENVCPECRQALTRAVKSVKFGTPTRYEPKQEHVDKPKNEVESIVTEPEREHEKPVPAEVELEREERPLANQVVKQFPINLPKRD